MQCNGDVGSSGCSWVADPGLVANDAKPVNARGAASIQANDSRSIPADHDASGRPRRAEKQRDRSKLFKLLAVLPDLEAAVTTAICRATSSAITRDTMARYSPNRPTSVTGKFGSAKRMSRASRQSALLQPHGPQDHAQTAVRREYCLHDPATALRDNRLRNDPRTRATRPARPDGAAPRSPSALAASAEYRGPAPQVRWFISEAFNLNQCRAARTCAPYLVCRSPAVPHARAS